MKQPLARAFGGEAFWLRRVETALIVMHSPPSPFFLLLFFFFSFSCYWVLSYYLTILFSLLLLSVLYSLQSLLLLCWTRPVQPSPAQPVPNTPQNKVPARRNRGLSPSSIFGPSLYCLSGKSSNSISLSFFLYLCQSFSSFILPACHDQRHVFTGSVRCGAQCLRFTLWWWWP